jgi:hypothetical protein
MGETQNTTDTGDSDTIIKMPRVSCASVARIKTLNTSSNLCTMILYLVWTQENNYTH